MKTNTLSLIFALSLCPCALSMEQRTPWNGESYDAHSAPQYQAAMASLAELDIKQCTSVLDVGTGNGRITYDIARMHPQTYFEAIDTSESMITIARTTYGNLSNLKFALGDAAHLEYDKKFMLVLSFNCLHWVKNKQAVFEGFNRSLKPGGSFLITMGGKNDRTDAICYTIIENLKKSGNWEFLNHFKLEDQQHAVRHHELEEILKNAGFGQLSIKEELMQPTFANKEAFIDWMSSWIDGFPAIAQLPDLFQRKLANAIAEEYLTLIPPQHDGTITYTWPQLSAKGRKPIS